MLPQEGKFLKMLKKCVWDLNTPPLLPLRRPLSLVPSGFQPFRFSNTSASACKLYTSAYPYTHNPHIHSYTASPYTYNPHSHSSTAYPYTHSPHSIAHASTCTHSPHTHSSRSNSHTAYPHAHSTHHYSYTATAQYQNTYKQYIYSD